MSKISILGWGVLNWLYSSQIGKSEEVINEIQLITKKELLHSFGK